MPLQVLEVSRRLLQLYQLLGGVSTEADTGGATEVLEQQSGVASVSGPDVVWMVTREPGLLTADFRRVARRLLEMKVRKCWLRW